MSFFRKYCFSFNFHVHATFIVLGTVHRVEGKRGLGGREGILTI